MMTKAGSQRLVFRFEYWLYDVFGFLAERSRRSAARPSQPDITRDWTTGVSSRLWYNSR